MFQHAAISPFHNGQDAGLPKASSWQLTLLSEWPWSRCPSGNPLLSYRPLAPASRMEAGPRSKASSRPSSPIHLPQTAFLTLLASPNPLPTPALPHLWYSPRAHATAARSKPY